MINELSRLTQPAANRLIASKQTISVSESSTGGLISAALLSRDVSPVALQPLWPILLLAVHCPQV